MTHAIDIEGYLHRIGYQGAREPSADVLAALQRAHLLAVPFENLDIHLGRPIRLDVAALQDKIVARRRGGFCYELNGLFGRLLAALGFRVRLLSARVFGPGGEPGPEFDHLALDVEVEGGGRWLVDVGFGDAFVAPLDLERDGPQEQRERAYRITRDERGLVYAWREPDGARPDGAWPDGAPPVWIDQYVFSLAPRALPEFEDMCRYHQTSPDSPFTRKRVITKLTETGRVTLGERALLTTTLTTTGSERSEQPIEGDDAWDAALQRVFGLARAAL